MRSGPGVKLTAHVREEPGSIPGGLCYNTDYGRNERSYDRDISFHVIKLWLQWNDRSYGEMAIATIK